MQEAPGHSAQLTMPEEGAEQQSPATGSRHKQSAASALDSKQCQDMPTKREAEAPTAAAEHLEVLLASTAAPAKPAQAREAAVSDQQAAAASSKPVSTAAASQSSAAKAMPASDEFPTLRPHEQKVAAALLVVMRRAAKDGSHAFLTTKQILTCNNPFVSPFMELLPDHSKLPSLKQLERSATVVDQETLRMLSEQCAAAGCEPLEVFTRSAECFTHLRTQQRQTYKETIVRQERLLGIELSLTVSAAAEVRGRTLGEELHWRTRALAKHGVARNLRHLLAALLLETMFLLATHKEQLKAATAAAGSRSSFTVCIDHMLPGKQMSKLQGLHIFCTPLSMTGTCMSCLT